MRLILTWRRWALIDVEVLAMKRIDGNEDTELDDADRDPLPFGFGVGDD